MAKDFDSMEDSNRSANPSIHEVSDPGRRVFLLGGIGALTIGALSPWLACDPATGEVRRFLTGPVGCEITGLTLTPDGRTMFVNIQHPGEPLTPRDDNLEVPNLHSNPADPRRYSNWPDFRPDGRPRSATVAIRKLDGGPIGT